MAGIEPATATLAGRARYLSCHPRRQASASFASTCRLHGAHAVDVSIIQPVREAFRDERFWGRSIRPEVNETAPEGLSPGAAAGKCLLALTRQPLRRPGQPKAAAPDSCIRAASAPGERPCIHGKPMTETGQLHFPGAFRDAAPVPGGAGIRVGAGVSVRRGSSVGRPHPVWCGTNCIPCGTPPPEGVPASVAAWLQFPERRLRFGGRLHLVGRVLRRRRLTRFCHSDTARTEGYDMNASFMLLEQHESGSHVVGAGRLGQRNRDHGSRQ
jgi:hypothetical protein